MTYEEEATPREKKISRAFAIGLHLVFLVLIVFGVSWQKRSSEPAAVVDLWSSMAPPRQETPRQETPLKLTPKIENEPPPPPLPKPEVKAVPKPDIALKDKLEKERKLKEREELDKKLKAQQQVENKKKDEEKRKLEQALAQEAEAKRLAAEKEVAAKQAQTAAQARLYDKYIALIQSRIKSHIVEPPNLTGNPQVEFHVVLIPGGEVLSARMTRSSGAPAYDSAVERAILKASPLPLPPDPAVFAQFRELNLKIRPKE